MSGGWRGYSGRPESPARGSNGGRSVGHGGGEAWVLLRSPRQSGAGGDPGADPRPRCGARLARWRYAATPAAYLLTMGIVAGEVRQAGPAHLGASFAGAAPWWFVTAVALAVAGWALMTLKWRLVLRALGVELPFARLFAFNLTAQLWNLVLPGQVGGEVYRGGRLAAADAPAGKVASAAILDRGTTVMATALLGLVGLARVGQGAADRRVLACLAVVALAPLGGYALLRYPPTGRALRRLVAIALPGQGARALDGAIGWVADRPAPLAALLVFAIACQFVFTLDWDVLARAFGAVVGVWRLAWILAVAALLPYVVPLPGAGMAVQQGVLVWLLVLTGTPAEQAGALALSGPIVAVLLGILGMALDGVNTLATRRGRRPGHALVMPTGEGAYD